MVEIDLNVSNYKSYVAASKNFENNRAYETISVNLQNILLLKKLTCFEVTYFVNFKEPGLVMKVFGNMLKSTMAKTPAWNLLAEDLATILKYFFTKFKKIKDLSSNWWSFYSCLLSYTCMLCQRAESKTDAIVGILAEYVLKLISMLDLHQMIQALNTFNYISSTTSRELRSHLKKELDPLFVELSMVVVTCHFVPVQLLCMETLNRWLVNRTSREARVVATTTWFQGYPTAVRLFQDNPCQDFLADNLSFLNKLNEMEDLVVSVVCRKLYVGDLAIITGNEKSVSYLHINTAQRCMTVVLTPFIIRQLQIASERPSTHEVIVITHDIVTHAELHRENNQLVLSVWCVCPPKLLYDESTQFQSRHVSVHVSSRTHIDRLDTAMKHVFHTLYQNKLDGTEVVKSQVQPSPDVIPDTARMRLSGSEDDRNISLSRRRKRSGHQSTWRSGPKSPSSVSTTSLVQLRSRLSELPPIPFRKRSIKIKISPRLTPLSETTEPGSSRNTTMSSVNRLGVKTRKQAQSDTEGGKVTKRLYTHRESSEEGSRIDTILQATLIDMEGNEIIDQLVKEVFVPPIGDTGDKKISSDENTSEAIENTPFEPIIRLKMSSAKPKKTQNKPNKCTVLSNTSDESNTDVDNVIQETPAVYVNVRRKKNTRESSEIDFDFFAELVRDDTMLDTNIDPELARKINTTPDSEIEDGDVVQGDGNVVLEDGNVVQEDGNVVQEDGNIVQKDANVVQKDANVVEEYGKVIQEDGNIVQDDDVFDCLSTIIDKVCQELDICAEEDTVGKSRQNDDMENIGDALISENDKDVNEIQETQNKKDTKIQKITKKGKTPKIVLKPEAVTSKNIEYFELNSKQDPLNEIEVLPIQRQVTPEEELFKKKIVIPENKPKPQKKKQRRQKKKALNKNKLKFKTLENMPNDNAPEPKDIDVPKELELAEINPISKNESPSKTANETPSNNGKGNVAINNKENAYDSDDAPLKTRRKRKLYSPKDDEIEQAVINYEDDISQPSDTKRTQSPQKYYQDKTPKKRQRGQSKSETVESPRSAKYNAIFDSLKKTEIVAKIFAPDKNNSKDISIYNFSSDSEDEELIQQKANLKARMSSSTLCSTDSLMSRRGRAMKNVDYTEKSSSESTKKKPARKTKTKPKRKPKTTTKLIDRPLIDERMREAQPEDIDTSFVKEQNKSVDKEKSPPKIIHEMEMDVGNFENEAIDAETTKKADNNQDYDLIEVIAENINETEPKEDTHKEVPIKANPSKTKQTKNKSKNKKRQTPKVEENLKPDEKKKSESPLPDLIMETKLNNEDTESSMLTNNFVEKCKQLLECSDETNTTHNLLSDSQDNDSVHSPARMENDIYNDVQHYNDMITEINNNNNFTDINNDNKNVIEIHNDIEDVITIPDYTKHRKKISHIEYEMEIITVDEPKTNKKAALRKDMANLITYIEDVTEIITADEPKTNKEAALKKDMANLITYIKDVTEIITVDEPKTNKKATPRKDKANLITHVEDVTEIITVDEPKTNKKPKQRQEKANLIRNIKKEFNDVPKNTTRVTRIQKNVSISSESGDEKSIPTNGNSPITAHGEELESPPNVDMLREVFVPRNVQIEQFDKTLQDYFHELNDEVQNSSLKLKELKAINTNEKESRRFKAKSASNLREKVDTFNRNVRPKLSTQTRSQRSTIAPINLDFLTGNTDKNLSESSDESPAQSTRSMLKRRKDFDTSSNDECPSPPKVKCTTDRKKQIDSPPMQTKRFTGREKIVELPSPPRTKRFAGREKLAESPSPPNTKRFTGREKIAESPSPPRTKRFTGGDKMVESPSPPNTKRFTGREKLAESPTTPFKKVDDWLKKSSSVTSSADAFTNCVLNIMEKVDTVLTERQQESNESTINFLMQDREQLEAIEKQIDDRYTALVGLMEKSHQLTKNMLETYKIESTRRAKEMLRRECMKKQAVVRLIREDVQAYFEEVNRNSRLN